MRCKAKVLASIATFGIILGMALMGMALKGYKSNNNVVYSSKYHVVWKPKYRRSALLRPIAKRRKAGVLSHTLRQEFRPLESQLPTLWTNRYLVSTVGRAALVGHKTIMVKPEERVNFAYIPTTSSGNAC
jgi:REP element-mobilizing transposase RayT